MPLFGLLLPHFGIHADAQKILRGCRQAERGGFDSVWVRDHLLFHPHGEFEHRSRHFLEALTVLTAVGASTERLLLGTAALIPFRHPIHLALCTATMSRFVGDRLILGLGSGNDTTEFEAIGLGGAKRPELVEKSTSIMKQLWAGKKVSWHDDDYDFEDAVVEPPPVGRKIPVFYCGSSPKGARMAASGVFDGWMPGRLPLDTLKVRVAAIERERERVGCAGAPRTTIGTVPITSLGATKEAALQAVHVAGLLAAAEKNRFWEKPESGAFRTAEDLGGMLLYGNPNDVASQAYDLLEAGVDHLVFDFRMSFERWEEQLQVVGEEVLPLLQ